MGNLWQDLRYALRQLRKSPAFAAVAIVTLAVGIGANTAIFSVVEHVLLQKLPYEHLESLVEIWNTYVPVFPQMGIYRLATSRTSEPKTTASLPWLLTLAFPRALT